MMSLQMEKVNNIRQALKMNSIRSISETYHLKETDTQYSSQNVSMDFQTSP